MINHKAATTAALGILGIMYATGKEPPGWLKLLALGTSVVSVANASQNIIVSDNATIAGMGCAPQNERCETCPKLGGPECCYTKVGLQ